MGNSLVVFRIPQSVSERKNMLNLNGVVIENICALPGAGPCLDSRTAPPLRGRPARDEREPFGAARRNRRPAGAGGRGAFRRPRGGRRPLPRRRPLHRRARPGGWYVHRPPGRCRDGFLTCTPVGPDPCRALRPVPFPKRVRRASLRAQKWYNGSMRRQRMLSEQRRPNEEGAR